MELTFTLERPTRGGDRRDPRPWTLLPVLPEARGFVRTLGETPTARALRERLRAPPGTAVRRVEQLGDATLYSYEGARAPPLHAALAQLVRELGQPEAQLQAVDVEGGVAQAVLTFPPRDADAEEATRDCFVAAAHGVHGWTVRLERWLSSPRRLVEAGCRGARISELDFDTLRQAHRAGYYSTPRRCTLDDLARLLDLSRGGVWRRLTRAEAAVVAACVARAPRPLAGVPG